MHLISALFLKFVKNFQGKIYPFGAMWMKEEVNFAVAAMVTRKVILCLL